MQILILDTTAERQADYAYRIQAFPLSELETMDISITMASDQDYQNHIENIDLIILGSALKERAFNIAREISKNHPQIAQILFVAESSYSQRIIRNAHYVGVRKVLADNVSDLDLLQELVAIDAEFRRDGKATLGKIISVISAKGGNGCTSITAALAEVANENRHKTILWDLDLETRDLSRGLSIFSTKGSHYSDWLLNQEQLNKKAFNAALAPVSKNVSLLMPPDDFTLSSELFYTENGTATLERLLDLSRYSHQFVLIDIGNNRGYGVDSLLSMSDEIIVVVSDCLLDASGIEIFLSNLKRSIGTLDKVRILVNGQEQEFLVALKNSISVELPAEAWQLPALPSDYKGGEWPGSGNTLYSLSGRDFRQALSAAAAVMDLAPQTEALQAYGKKAWLRVLSGSANKPQEKSTQLENKPQAALPAPKTSQAI